MKKATHLTDIALSRRRFSVGLPLLAAGAAAPQEVIAAKAPWAWRIMLRALQPLPSQTQRFSLSCGGAA